MNLASREFAPAQMPCRFVCARPRQSRSVLPGTVSHLLRMHLVFYVHGALLSGLLVCARGEARYATRGAYGIPVPQVRGAVHVVCTPSGLRIGSRYTVRPFRCSGEYLAPGCFVRWSASVPFCYDLSAQFQGCPYCGRNGGLQSEQSPNDADLKLYNQYTQQGCVLFTKTVLFRGAF